MIQERGDTAPSLLDVTYLSLVSQPMARDLFFYKNGCPHQVFSFSRSALTVSFNQEQDDQEAGPSGISRKETLALLALDRSDPEQEEENFVML